MIGYKLPINLVLVRTLWPLCLPLLTPQMCALMTSWNCPLPFSAMYFSSGFSYCTKVNVALESNSFYCSFTIVSIECSDPTILYIFAKVQCSVPCEVGHHISHGLHKLWTWTRSVCALPDRMCPSLSLPPGVRDRHPRRSCTQPNYCTVHLVCHFQLSSF